MTEETAVWSPTSSKIFLEDEEVNYEAEAFVHSEGTSVWDKIYSRICEDDIKEVYSGPAKLFVHKNN